MRSIEQSARPSREGVHYSIWAPKHALGEVVIVNRVGETIRVVLLERAKDGVFTGRDPQGRAGDLYTFRFGENAFPDPASHFQPYGVHGPSEVIDHRAFTWPAKKFDSPSLRNLVIYECHIGTFTPEGNFEAAIGKLPHLQELGVTALQIMPVADFAGDRNWGYDGVSLYAPSRAYGRPEDLKRLVAAAHAAGIAVILDVVYNHFGPDGNYLETCTDQFFSTQPGNIWGKNIDFDGAGSQHVREFFLGNIMHWMDHYRIDGFRLDATHAIKDSSEPHILAEIAREVELRGGFTIAEDDRNLASLLEPREKGGYGIGAAWADDFHHVVKVRLTGERFAHFLSFEGKIEELKQTLENGWLYIGQQFPYWKKPRGTPCAHLGPEQFVYCISNHDQAGNRPLGERLNHLISNDAYRAASALICLVPYTPMLFMGQEWAASTAFCFFTNHAGKIGENVSKGRLNEFRHYEANYSEEVLSRMPDPQDEQTFLDAKLKWEEIADEKHRGVFDLHKAALAFRHRVLTAEARARGNFRVEQQGEALLIHYPNALVACDLKGGASATLPEGRWRIAVAANGPAGGEVSGSITCQGPQTLALERA